MRQFQQVKEFISGKLEKDLPPHLSYHNLVHTEDVMQAAETIAIEEGIGENDKELLLTAALFHDTGFFVKRDEHETESCAFANYYLPLYGYNEGEIELICRLIMATRIQQSPGCKLAEILCDADLDYLGRNDFFKLSARLFKELKAEGIIKDEEEWNREQADFIGSHHYFSAAVEKLRQAEKEKYVEIIRSKIIAGTIDENQ